MLLQDSLSGQVIDSSGENYMATWSRVHDSSQITWTNNYLSPFYTKIESESATPGIPPPYLRDLLLPPLAEVSSTLSESETAVSSEIPPTYSHTSPLYNHAQLRDLLMTSRTASSSAQIENETTSSSGITSTTRDDVTAVTSHPAMTSPVGVANIRVKLCNAKLWRQFHACTNEMIITKAGRQDYVIYLFLVDIIIIITILSFWERR